jgi:hypothetical protein
MSYTYSIQEFLSKLKNGSYSNNNNDDSIQFYSSNNTLNDSRNSFNASIDLSNQSTTMIQVASASAATVEGGGRGGDQGLTNLETLILRSQVPIEINEIEQITINNQCGIWASKNEEINWKLDNISKIPLHKYPINDDPTPEIIKKKLNKQIEYVQEMAVRYLRPPTPPQPGEIIIKQEQNKQTPPAPPLIIRQQPARPSTPEPLIIRESPPKPPAPIGRKLITISGKRLPPAPRKVIIERLAQLPTKPQSVIVERWLPYSTEHLKRKVIFRRASQPDPSVVKPRNVIVQWDAPNVLIKKDYKYLGTVRANPSDYVQRYGSSLKDAKDLPSIVYDIKTPSGIRLASEQINNQIVHELEGDVDALNLINLENEGLAVYRNQLDKYNAKNNNNNNNNDINLNDNYFNSSIMLGPSSYTQQQQQQQQLFTPNEMNAIEQIFSQIDIDSNGNISVEEAEKIFLRLNSRLNRSYGENEVAQFFYSLDSNRDGNINLNEFKLAFQNSFFTFL